MREINILLICKNNSAVSAGRVKCRERAMTQKVKRVVDDRFVSCQKF
ncbi:hypothetical protein DOT_2104 [Desulfosporosinus sp. OT]|nr:hypothetical protein DOT_2104 [Desulfosporosinus sp. OT]